jgi:hypothetical protein
MARGDPAGRAYGIGGERSGGGAGRRFWCAGQQSRSLCSQGKYADATTVGERVLKLTEQAQGPNDPATAVALNNLAVATEPGPL